MAIERARPALAVKDAPRFGGAAPAPVDDCLLLARPVLSPRLARLAVTGLSDLPVAREGASPRPVGRLVVLGFVVEPRPPSPREVLLPRPLAAALGEALLPVPPLLEGALFPLLLDDALLPDGALLLDSALLLDDALLLDGALWLDGALLLDDALLLDGALWLDPPPLPAEAPLPDELPLPDETLLPVPLALIPFGAGRLLVAPSSPAAVREEPPVLRLAVVVLLVAMRFVAPRAIGMPSAHARQTQRRTRLCG